MRTKSEVPVAISISQENRNSRGNGRRTRNLARIAFSQTFCVVAYGLRATRPCPAISCPRGRGMSGDMGSPEASAACQVLQQSLRTGALLPPMSMSRWGGRCCSALRLLRYSGLLDIRDLQGTSLYTTSLGVRLSGERGRSQEIRRMWHLRRRDACMLRTFLWSASGTSFEERWTGAVPDLCAGGHEREELRMPQRAWIPSRRRRRGVAALDPKTRGQASSQDLLPKLARCAQGKA